MGTAEDAYKIQKEYFDKQFGKTKSEVEKLFNKAWSGYVNSVIIMNSKKRRYTRIIGKKFKYKTSDMTMKVWKKTPRKSSYKGHYAVIDKDNVTRTLSYYQIRKCYVEI